MLCASCETETAETPCSSCGEEALLDGRYALAGIVGRGSSGTTWEARTSEGQRVALKEMVLARHDTEKSRELWEREAAVLRQLDHPQIPSFVEVFSTGTGRSRSLCLVQEFVEGTTLADELENHRYTEAEVLAVGEELTGILQYLHGLSPPVIHRDLKPANVIRRPDGSLSLIDFGSVRDSLKNVQLGGSTVAGTFGFMAPEQFRGEAVPATDYYALGALLAALLTRKQPAEMLGDDRRLGWQEHCAPSPEMRGVLTGLLTADPTKRSTDLQQLRTISFAEPVAASPAAALFEPSVDALPVKASTRPVQAAAAGIGAAGVLAGLMVAVFAVSLLLVVGMFYVQSASISEVTSTETSSAGPAGFVYNAGPENVLVFSNNQQMQVLPGDFSVLDEDGPEPMRFRWNDDSTVLPDALDPEKMVRCDLGGCALEPIPLLKKGEAPWEVRHAPLWPSSVGESEGQRCVVDVWIGADGTVAATHVESCPTPFAVEAEKALQQWTMSPAGTPRRTTVAVKFNPRKD